MLVQVVLATAFALAEPSVNAVVLSCEEARTREIERLVAVELTGHPTSPDTALTVICTPDDVTLRATSGGASRERHLDAATSERTVALAAIELIDSFEMPEPVVPTPSAPGRTRPWLVTVQGFAGRTREPAQWTYGGGVGADVRVLHAWPPLVLHLDLTALRTARELSAGDASLTLLGVGAGAGVRTAGPRWRTFVAAGLRVGPAFVDGTASDADVTVRRATRAWLGPFITARLEHAFGERVVAFIGGEAGYVVRGLALRVDGSREASLNGAWLLATVGVGVAP